MARKITFVSKQHDEFFSLIHSFFHLGARPTTREEHRITDRILSALESISIAEDDPIDGFPRDDSAPRQRCLSGGYIILEDNEFGFMKDALGKIGAPAYRSRSILAMWDFLDSTIQGRAKDLVKEETDQLEKPAQPAPTLELPDAPNKVNSNS